MMHRIEPTDLLLAGMSTALVMLANESNKPQPDDSVMIEASRTYARMYQRLRTDRPYRLTDIMRAVPIRERANVATFLACVYGETVLHYERVQPSAQREPTGKETDTNG